MVALPSMKWDWVLHTTTDATAAFGATHCPVYPPAATEPVLHISSTAAVPATRQHPPAANERALAASAIPIHILLTDSATIWGWKNAEEMNCDDRCHEAPDCLCGCRFVFWWEHFNDNDNKDDNDV